MNALTPAQKALIEMLAKIAAQDYLRRQAAAALAAAPPRTERVALPATDKAA